MMAGSDEIRYRNPTRRPRVRRACRAAAIRSGDCFSRDSPASAAGRVPGPKATPRERYRVVIVGRRGHGLATAFYLATEYGISDVAVLEKGPIGWANVGRNTTIIRSNYFHPDNIRFYEYSLKLWETLERHADFQCDGEPARHPQPVSHRGAARSVHAARQQ